MYLMWPAWSKYRCSWLPLRNMQNKGRVLVFCTGCFCREVVLVKKSNRPTYVGNGLCKVYTDRHLCRPWYSIISASLILVWFLATAKMLCTDHFGGDSLLWIEMFGLARLQWLPFTESILTNQTGNPNLWWLFLRHSSRDLWLWVKTMGKDYG